MSSHLWRALLISASLTILLFAFGCDEPNTADIPPQPYHLAAIYATPAPAIDVDADGNFVAVALGVTGYGAMVFDVSNPAAPELVHHEECAVSEIYYRVAVDALHNFLYVDNDGSRGDGYYLIDFANHESVLPGNIPFSSNVDEVLLVPSADSILVFRTDFSDGLQSRYVCKINDSTWSAVESQCPYTWEVWDPTGEDSTGLRIRGFGRREDNIFAIAISTSDQHDDDRIHLRNGTTSENLSDAVTAGIPYDCAWYGNYIMVADRYRLTVMDATDLTDPVVATSLTISGADRLVKVAVDGNYAFLLDELDGVYVVDISNPLAPKHLQTFSLPEATSLDAVNGRVYVSDAVQGLAIYAR